MYTPRLCIGIEGNKELAVGDTLFTYGAGDELVASVALPVTGRISTAPYLAFTMDLDPLEIAQMHLELPPAGETSTAFLTGPACPQLLDAVTRALRMLEHPEEIAMLGPLVRREILFRVLSGPRGAMLRRITQGGGHVEPIARAIAVLRERYAEALDVEARPPRRHERDVVLPALQGRHRDDPLQYQKQLRLQEARHLLLGEDLGRGHGERAGRLREPHPFHARPLGWSPRRRDTGRLRAGITGA